MPLPSQSPQVSNLRPPAAEPKSDLLPHEIEQQKKIELLQRVKVMRERMATNQGMVDGMKKDKVYVWVHISDNRQIHFQAMGYELCKDPEIKSKWKRADNSHVRGDVILYQCDKDLHEAIDLDGQLRAIEAVEGAKEGFKAVAARNGFPIYEPGKQR